MASTLSADTATVQEFDAKRINQELVDAFKQGHLKNALYKLWSRYVPEIYQVPCRDSAAEERRAKKCLFKPMEVLLCNGDPDNVFEQLKEQNEPPQLCGRVFKMGEPTYSCRECAVDPTCVLCIECFEKSSHKTHRYKMSTSGGGGYCDCGDVEAWRTDPFCEIHKRKDDMPQEDKNPMELLPADIHERAREIFAIVMLYSVELLTSTETEVLLEGLSVPENCEDYCTMLFNDEVHTYEQVILTLQSAVDCTHKEAVEFATVVDREGRCSVLNSGFTQCEKACGIIKDKTTRRGSKPLKCLVMKTPVVAHQTFALKMFSWLQNMMSYSEGLRRLFCVLAMEPTGNMSLMQRILYADTNLWKIARIQSHQLFMSGVMLDLECKKQFAIIFTQHYPQLTSDFIQDDHYRSASATSLSVQIFTVPTLARMLIAEHDLLTVILSTFFRECESKKNEQGTFSFQRIDRSPEFKRSQYILYDLKYALTCKPLGEEWTDLLRQNFIKGFNVLLELLKCMQGMDAVTRQTGHHLEFEPEWEGAFNLQLKLEDNLAMVLEWCSTDRQVLIDAYKATFTAIYSTSSAVNRCNNFKCRIADHETTCVRYEVSSEPISIHLPLSRLLAGLHLLLKNFDIKFGPEIFPEGLHVDPVHLMELPLRTLVMIAQSHAGMWKRNGYSLLNQIYFYINVRCREEMYDKDIVLLQIGASLVDSNEFLIHFINKFGLLTWIREEYDIPGTRPQEDSVRQTITLAEEFLNLLLLVLNERYVPGVGQVTKADCIKREIIHQLCIGPATHSELTKQLHEDAYHETGLEENVHLVADFKRSDTGKGMYELKPEFYVEYNPFFYHYSKQEQSKSEEVQRKRRKLAGQNRALPPPVPPPVTSVFSRMIHILNSDVMFRLLKLILTRTHAKWSRSWSEVQFEKALHLIGLALHEERRAHVQHEHEPFSFTEKAGEIYNLLESLLGHPNVSHDGQKDLLTWVIKAFNEVCCLRNDSEMKAEVMEVLKTPDEEKREKEKKRKAELASKRRADLLAKMSAMQKNFIKENADLFEATNMESEMTPAISDMDLSQSSEDSDSQVAIGLNRSTSGIFATTRETCILCQEEEEVTCDGRALVLASFIQRSTVLSKTRGRVIDNPEEHDPLFMPPDLFCAPYSSTCGHVMHSDCWQRYFDSILQKEQRRPMRRLRQPISYNVENLEFLCPLCETLSNTVIPLIPHLNSLTAQCNSAESDVKFCDWLDAMEKTVKNSLHTQDSHSSGDSTSVGLMPFSLSQLTHLLTDTVAASLPSLFQFSQQPTNDPGRFSSSMIEMIKKFAYESYMFGLGVHIDEHNPRVPLLAWQTTAFTVQVIEQSLREESKPLFGSLTSRQHDCVSATVRHAAVVSQAFPASLIRKHCLQLLTGLLADSSYKQENNLPNILGFDAFHCLVSLTCSLPCLYVEMQEAPIHAVPTGRLNDQHVLRLVFMVHITQILLTADIQPQDSMDTEADTDAIQLLRILRLLRRKAGVEVLADEPSGHQLQKYVWDASLPFLRCAAMFYHHITGVSPPAILWETGNKIEELCQFLNLPSNFSEVFQVEIEQLFTRWCCDSSVQSQLKDCTGHIIRYPLSVNQLVSLPQDYSVLINKVSSFTCPNSDGDESRAPTMCLVCGEILCSQSYCCQTDLEESTVGAATAHAYSCGANVGLFLRVRECQILLLAGKRKGCFYPPPYLDDYGETDQGLRRGNPLHLCPTRLKKLHKLWLSHGIPEEVTHSLETNSNLLQIEWHHL